MVQPKQRLSSNGPGSADVSVVALNTRVRDDGRVVWAHHLAYPPADGPVVPDIGVPWTGLTGTDVPVLLVRATHGYLAPEVVETFRQQVPRAAVVEIDTGHNVQEQDPVGLAAAITAFLPDGGRP